MSWKELAISVAIGVVLSIWISCCAPMEVSAPSPEPGGQGYEQKGESGLVVSGSGAELVTARELTTSSRRETAASEAATNASGSPEQSREETEPDSLRGYWYGVGAVLMGQVVAVLFFVVFKCWR